LEPTTYEELDSMTNAIRQHSDFTPLRPIAPGPRPVVVRKPRVRKPRANPRDSWPKWTDFVSVSIVEEPGDEPRPTASFGALPDAWSEAFWKGFTLALEGEDPAIPTDRPGYESRAFHAGLVAGSREADHELDQWADQQAMERMMAAFGDPNDLIDPNEACGVC
jgi:hypothetical protein